MSDFSIDKKTGISIGLLIVLAPVAFWGITAWARMQAQTERNSVDIASILGKIDTLNTNLTETNGNIIELNTRLDGLAERQGAQVSVIPLRSTETVVVVSRGSTAMQPHTPAQQNGVQPSSAPPRTEEPQPEPEEPEASQEQPTLGDLVNVAQQAIDHVVEALAR